MPLGNASRRRVRQKEVSSALQPRIKRLQSRETRKQRLYCRKILFNAYVSQCANEISNRHANYDFTYKICGNYNKIKIDKAIVIAAFFYVLLNFYLNKYKTICKTLSKKMCPLIKMWIASAGKHFGIRIKLHFKEVEYISRQVSDYAL